ncbi:MAG: hypothetical protein ACREA3_04420 [Nitrosotalea sp.]
MNKKYGIAIMACAIIIGVLAFTYNITNQTNSWKSQPQALIVESTRN